MEDLKELEKNYEELGKEIERLKSFQNIGRAERGNRYFFVDSYGNECNDRDYANKQDDFRYDTGNYFLTIQELSDNIEKSKIRAKLERLAIKLNGGRKINWNDTNTSKYKIVFDFDNYCLYQESNCCQCIQGAIYCTNINFLEEAKKEIGEADLKKLFE